MSDQRKLTVFRGRLYELKQASCFQRVCIEPGATLYLNNNRLDVLGKLLICRGARIVIGGRSFVRSDDDVDSLLWPLQTLLSRLHEDDPGYEMSPVDFSGLHLPTRFPQR